MTTLFKPIITLQLELQSNKLHIYVCIYTFLIVIHIIQLKKWQKPGQEEWTISKSFVSQPPQIWGCSGVCEPPGHVAWQNGKRATPKERAERETSCQGPENHSNTLHKCGNGTRKARCGTSPQLSTQITAQQPSVEARNKALVIQRATSQDCSHQGKEKGGVYPWEESSKVPGVILRKSYILA